MFIMCQKMDWNHLPVAGGIYDQDPELLRRWGIIFRKIEEKEAAERKKDEAKRKSATRRGASRAR